MLTKHFLKVMQSIGGEYSRDDFIIVDPKFGGERKSAYAKDNLYTFLIDNSPYWSKYPKRSKSIICATTIEKAAMYGYSVYIVFPVNGSKVAQSSGDDLWHSFYRTVSSLGTFAENIKAVIHGDITFDGFGLPYDVSTYENVKKTFKRFDDLMKTHKLTSAEENWLIYLNWWKEYKGNLLETLQKMMKPERNHITLKNVGEYLEANREVWTDGLSVMVKLENEDLIKNI